MSLGNVNIIYVSFHYLRQYKFNSILKLFMLTCQFNLPHTYLHQRGFATHGRQPNQHYFRTGCRVSYVVLYFALITPTVVL
jgi:hypothetical protein